MLQTQRHSYILKNRVIQRRKMNISGTGGKPCDGGSMLQWLRLEPDCRSSALPRVCFITVGKLIEVL